MKAGWKGAGYSTIGLEFVLSILFGFFGGRWLDTQLNTGPWLMVVGGLLGVFAAFRSIYRAAQRMKSDAGTFTENQTDRRTLARRKRKTSTDPDSNDNP